MVNVYSESTEYNDELCSTEQSFNHGVKVQNIIGSGVRCFLPFSDPHVRLLEMKVNETVRQGDNRCLKPMTVDRAALRNKYFFAERYTYGSQMTAQGPGNEILFPVGAVDAIPHWLRHLVIKPLVLAEIVPDDFINSAVINVYQPGGCIVSHVDPRHIFDRPIVSVSLFSDSILSFGCKFSYKPIRTTEPIYAVPMQRGGVTVISGFAANGITHCVRPQDTVQRRAVILLRKVLPDAPRITLTSRPVIWSNEEL